MSDTRPRVYLFGWPSHLGGADTKFVHLLRLLHRDVCFTVVPNDEGRLQEREWTEFLDSLGVHAAMLDQLPPRLEGLALALANGRYFSERIAHRAKERGLTVGWSSEMMWHHPGELDAARDGVIDFVLYTSDFQRGALSPGYGNLPGYITGNYIDPTLFPFVERRNGSFAIGRLSRAAREKYPENFPVFYEDLALPDTRYRVMAWSQALANKYAWHKFGREWDLLLANQEPAATFLQSLDLFVYPLGHAVEESWGRSTVEAMLTGAVPLVPKGHHFENLIMHGESGFLCEDFDEWREYARRLRLDAAFRAKMSRNAHEHAATHLCNAEEHRRVWLAAFAAASKLGVAP